VGDVVEFADLTLELNHDWMADEVLPISAHFFLAPKYHPDKGIMLGSDTGTALTLPAAFSDLRRTARLPEIPLERLVLRPTSVVDVSKPNGGPINESEIRGVLERAIVPKGNALLLRTGWGDEGIEHRGGSQYVLQGPFLSLEAAKCLTSFMVDRDSDLLLTDAAMIGRPDKFLIPEWCSLFPRPGPWPSSEAQIYLQLYTQAKMKEDFAAELILATARIMMVKRLVGCSAVMSKEVRIIVSPLHIVRGVASTCRVIALQE
jgi:kynurenine formamidase